MDLLKAIEASAFSDWVRSSGSLFAYSGFLFLHTIGLALLVGLNTMIDLRLLGAARTVPIGPLEQFFPFMWAGFWLNAVSGTVLFASDATSKVANPLFVLKMIFVGLAAAGLVAIRRVVFRAAGGAQVSPLARGLAAASLLLWLGAIVAGRLMTYVTI